MLMKCFETDAAGSTSTNTESDTPQHCNEGHGVGITAITSTEETGVLQPTSSMQRRARRAIPDFSSHVWTGIAGRLPCHFLRLLTAMPLCHTTGYYIDIVLGVGEEPPRSCSGRDEDSQGCVAQHTQVYSTEFESAWFPLGHCISTNTDV